MCLLTNDHIKIKFYTTVPISSDLEKEWHPLVVLID